MSLREEIRADFLKKEIQEDLMRTILLDGEEVLAMVGESMLDSSLVFGGVEDKHRERFRIPRTELIGMAPPRHGSTIIDQGRRYQVDDIDPDERSVSFSCSAIMIGEE